MIGSVRFSRLAVRGVYGVAIALYVLLPARAEFPPEGATPDPNNASIATGNFPSSTQSGGIVHTVFYFDCGTRNWVGVSVKAASGPQDAPAQAAGAGREYPPGPPTDSTRDKGNPNHALNQRTGQDFTFRDGNWFETKTGRLMKSPKLCPDAEGGHNSVKQQSGPNPSSTPIDEKPDHLPARPEFKSGQIPTPHP